MTISASVSERLRKSADRLGSACAGRRSSASSAEAEFGLLARCVALITAAAAPSRGTFWNVQRLKGRVAPVGERHLVAGKSIARLEGGLWS